MPCQCHGTAQHVGAFWLVASAYAMPCLQRGGVDVLGLLERRVHLHADADAELAQLLLRLEAHLPNQRVAPQERAGSGPRAARRRRTE